MRKRRRQGKRSGTGFLPIAIAAAVGFFAAHQGPELLDRATDLLVKAPPATVVKSAPRPAATPVRNPPTPSIVALGDPRAPRPQAPVTGGPGVIAGPVERIADGDTFTVAGQRIRICGINAPETSTAAGHRARDAMVALVGGKSVTCTTVGYGTPCDGRSSARSYDRVVAQCHVGGRDVAREMVRRGHAQDWARYSGGYYR